jgi:hypothetical protein
MEEKETSVTFRISKIQTLKFSLECLEEPEKFNEKNVAFEFSWKYDLSEKAKTIGITLIVNIFSEPSKKEKVSQLGVRVEFEVMNFEEIIKISDQNFNIPDIVIETFISIAYSTVRGILVAKTEGSVLSNVYLPVIKPSDFKNIQTK